MTVTIVAATTPADYADFAQLVAAYVEWFRVRYHDEAWFVDGTLGHQALDRELASLPAAYGPPNGRALLARDGSSALGCGAYRRRADGSCEMKRLFVVKGAQGQGLGRRLCSALIDSARADGYRLMRLDTVERMAEAIAMYRSLGFRSCPPYQSYPPEVQRRMVYMELTLEA